MSFFIYVAVALTSNIFFMNDIHSWILGWLFIFTLWWLFIWHNLISLFIIAFLLLLFSIYNTNSCEISWIYFMTPHSKWVRKIFLVNFTRRILKALNLFIFSQKCSQIFNQFIELKTFDIIVQAFIMVLTKRTSNLTSSIISVWILLFFISHHAVCNF